ncbi:MAG: sigma-70 family RNA polymerase sigma factor [Myxococcales bacterium]|nr:sigma-70 family RNA polymerase sigma factor [Polyangiaceae bacterium]MDW8250421.1 sigma-70 family RNA polymerase sigma factor [Myxococcales bacterium]
MTASLALPWYTASVSPLPRGDLAALLTKACPSRLAPDSLPVVADPVALTAAREGASSEASASALEEERREVELAQAGDRRALARLLRRYGPVIFRSVLLPRLGSRAAAEEALSVTYTKVVEKLDRFTWQSVGIYPWLRVVALRVALDQLRTRRREIPFDTEDLAREIDQAEREHQEADALTLARQDAEVARARVTEALARINPRYALAIRLRLLEERSREDAARELGVTTATFDVILHRALIALKKALSPDTHEQEP